MLKLTTDKHEASRGFSATAELLVFYNSAACFTRKNWRFWASKICHCNSLLCFKLMIMTDGLTSHYNTVGVVD